MKKIIYIIMAFALIISLSNYTSAQDNSNYTKEDLAKMKSSHVPDYTPRAPIAPNSPHSIPFITNCPQQDRPTCLKEAFDETAPGWIQAMPRNDDGSTGLIALGFNFNLYGTIYTDCYINNNGNITFSAPLGTYTPSAFPSTVFGAIVAPFFADVDTRNTASGVVWYKLETNRLTVVWDSVGYFNQHVDLTNTFELLISNGTDPLLGIGNNVCFSYGEMAWTTGDASLGIGGFGPPSTAATIGVNEGNGIDYATLGRFCRPGTYYGGPAIDTNGVAYLNCQTFCLNASNAGNICPVASGFPGGTVTVTAGTPYHGVYSFSAPEITQITSGSASGVPPNMTVVITNGLTCTFDVTFDPTCAQLGGYDVCFSGIDNAVDPCTTTVCVHYVVDCPSPVEMSSFSSSITGRDVSLAWTTTTEVNNSKFEIERANSVNNWQPIGTVNGNGNSSVPKSYSFTDRGLMSGTYNYRLKQIDFNGAFTYHNLSNEVVIGVPNQFELNQNYPNPFNPTTKIDYSIPYEGNVSLTIFDAQGKEVTRLVNSNQPAGYYSVNFNASNFASGIYYYRLEVSGQNKFVDSKKMLLVK